MCPGFDFPASEGFRWSSRFLLFLVGVAVTVSGISCSRVSERGPVRPKYYELASECKGQLREVVPALRAYVRDHDGDWPADLEELVPKYLPALPHCPADTFPNRQSYWYRQPAQTSEESVLVLSCERHRTPVGAEAEDGFLLYVTKDLVDVHEVSVFRKF